MLPCCCAVTLLCCNVVLPCCCAVALLCCNALVLFCCYSLLCYSSTAVLLCYTQDEGKEEEEEDGVCKENKNPTNDAGNKLHISYTYATRKLHINNK